MKDLILIFIYCSFVIVGLAVIYFDTQMYLIEQKLKTIQKKLAIQEQKKENWNIQDSEEK